MASTVFSTSILLLILCACGLTQDQAPQCSSLNVDNEDNAQPGSDLDVCSTTSLQCCTQAYLNQVKREARSRLLRGLQEELDDRREVFHETVRLVVQYFTATFPQVFSSHIPNIESFGPILSGQISQSIQDQLAPVFTNDLPTFDGARFIDSVLTQFDTAAISFLENLSIGGLTNDQQMCIRGFIDGIINTQVKSSIAQTLNQVHRSVVALNRILNFLGAFNRTAALYDVSEQCVSKLVELSFCGRCTNRLPPLCIGTCGALVRGCYAPFVTGLERAFNNLWNVSEQIVRTINMNIAELFTNEDQLLNGQTLIQLGLRIATDCDLSLSLPGRKKRQDDQNDLLPSRVLGDIRRLRGVFRYDNDGPDFCQPSDDEEEFCSGNEDQDGRDCDSDSVCTSSCQCWDGRTMQMEDQVTFDLDGIQDQDKNPVFPQNPDDLNRQAQMLADPVNAFLTSEEFTTVIPDGVTVPAAAPYTGRGDVTAVSSLGLLLVASVCALYAL